MSKRRTSLLLVGTLVMFLAFPVWAEAFSGKVVAVMDGDTIKVMHRGQAEKVRLLGVDCPEKRQAFGKKAKQFTAGLVMGQEVTVIAYKKDRYGRTLGYVILPDGRNLNRELAQPGYAWWCRSLSRTAA